MKDKCIPVLISACLLGMGCRYDGGGKLLDGLGDLTDWVHLIPVCPEIYGGLKTPREPAERKGNRIFTKSGKEVTDEYYKGAQEILRLSQFFHCSAAILKERSPSCGYGEIYDGSFGGKLVDGKGVAAELLWENGITVFGESQLPQFKDWIRHL